MELSEQMRLCIRDCQECAARCLEALAEGLDHGSAHTEAGHIQLLLDCAAFCQLSADFMARRSAFHQRVCGLCEDVCVRCAESCERFGEDVSMRVCTEYCRRCATSLAGLF